MGGCLGRQSIAVPHSILFLFNNPPEPLACNPLYFPFLFFLLLFNSIFFFLSLSFSDHQQSSRQTEHLFTCLFRHYSIEILLGMYTFPLFIYFQKETKGHSQKCGRTFNAQFQLVECTQGRGGRRYKSINQLVDK